MLKFVSHNENETKKIASRLASKLNHGDIIVLSGDLGSGKTKFTEGFLSYWGLEDEISSPTFTIVNEHNKDNTNIYHFDVYRLEDLDEFYAIGGTEYFLNGICVIEWGELIEDILPQNYIKISFSKDEKDDSVRYLNFEAYGENLETVIKELEL
ncbi:MAG: tRNA (adenosine(37)-N6)-threonylcarbamoyltransferase complex ATPase subunit type 1 TsaE [Clostridia bacterium]|nr:tRNA (adenosine(37)-N6)-threonylcarbamoyltransferase complex ATPase subunit type 1 TsaE [Clostridia bacterium]